VTALRGALARTSSVTFILRAPLFVLSRAISVSVHLR
jgi:hypothetical protein